MPDDGAPTSQWVEYAEARVGSELDGELEGYFDLANELIDVAGPLVATVTDHPGETRAVHVAALILARIISELAACVKLLRAGYAAQAITLVGTMLELTHVLAYIADDEQRATEWGAWDNPTKAYPGSVLKSLKGAAVVFGAAEADITREYDEIYRQICQTKHGNTLMLSLANSDAIEDYFCTVIGPIVSEKFIRLGHAAAQWSPPRLRHNKTLLLPSTIRMRLRRNYCIVLGADFKR